jgi:hypothetical protein
MPEPTPAEWREDPATDAAMNGPDVEPEDKAAELAGDEGRDSQIVFVQAEQLDVIGDESDLDVPIYEGELAAEGAGYDAERLEELTDLELRDGETDDPNVAAEEGLTYVPPTDPPVIPTDDRQGLEVAAGFGSTSLDEPFDADHHDELLYAEDEITARVRDALRADASTSTFADQIGIDTEGGQVVLYGTVESIDDTDNAAAVAEQVEGVDEVIDRLEVEGL